MMKEVTYQCRKCKATDTPRYFPDEPLLPVLICAKCHSGLGMPMSDQIQGGVGMWPASEPKMVQ